MQIHVFESTSSKPVARQMAKHNLGLCMLAMGELGRSYISATAAYKLFDTAIQKVEKARGCDRGQAVGAPDHASGLAPAVAVVGGTDGAQSDGAHGMWENWPEGYLTSTAGVIADVWLPWMNGAGIW